MRLIKKQAVDTASAQKHVENNSERLFIKNNQVVREKSSTKVTKYLKPDLDTTGQGPQTSEWTNSKGDEARLLTRDSVAYDFEETIVQDQEVEEPPRPSTDHKPKLAWKEQGILPGFKVASKSDYQLERFDPPVIPKDFVPHHKFPGPLDADDKYSIPPPPEVPPPDDNNMKLLIEGVATLVARCGKLFEDLSREKNKSNPLFSFLNGGNGHDYYARKLWEERQKRNNQKSLALDGRSSPSVQKMTAESRGKILGERPLERSLKDLSSSVVSADVNLQFSLSDTFTKPASFGGVPEVAKPFKDDPAKQERFERFLKEKYQGGLRSIDSIGASNMSESARARERLDFEAAAEAIEKGKWNEESKLSTQQLEFSAGGGMLFTSAGLEVSKIEEESCEIISNLDEDQEFDNIDFHNSDCFNLENENLDSDDNDGLAKDEESSMDFGCPNLQEHDSDGKTNQVSKIEEESCEIVYNLDEDQEFDNIDFHNSDCSNLEKENLDSDDNDGLAKDEESSMDFGCPNLQEHDSDGKTNQQHKDAHAEDLVTRKAYPKREEFQWRPLPVLCKRFDLIDPYMGKPPPPPRMRSKMDSLIFTSDSVKTSKFEEIVTANRDQVSVLQTDTQEISKDVAHGKKEIEVQVENVERPVDLYKAIFSDDSDDEVETPIVNKVDDPEKKVEVAHTTLNRLIAGDFLESLGKELGLEVPPDRSYSTNISGSSPKKESAVASAAGNMNFMPVENRSASTSNTGCLASRNEKVLHNQEITKVTESQKNDSIQGSPQGGSSRHVEHGPSDKRSGETDVEKSEKRAQDDRKAKSPSIRHRKSSISSSDDERTRKRSRSHRYSSSDSYSDSSEDDQSHYHSRTKGRKKGSSREKSSSSRRRKHSKQRQHRNWY
uniref:SURP motif domain-containing protein n=1 Tax=Manihot esculenta TaxID=3983 RepID=A0A2C9VXU1_MANES